jgi:hypothetical protein
MASFVRQQPLTPPTPPLKSAQENQNHAVCRSRLHSATWAAKSMEYRPPGVSFKAPGAVTT